MTQRKTSTPNKRAADKKKEITDIRRRYKVDVRKKKRLLPGEMDHVQTMVIVLQLAGYNRTQMAKIIGISRNQVAEMLNQVDTAEKLIALRARLPQAALELLQGYMIEAVQAIVEIMRLSTDDKYVLQAAGEILDRAGLPKASRQERSNVNEERITFTDDGIVERLRETSPEIQEQAAQMIEQLEGLLAEGMAQAEGIEESDEDS